MASLTLYDSTAEIYDVFELNGKDQTPVTNNLLISQFRRHGVENVLDMTCGTGAQTIALAAAGFRLTGSDQSKGMLEVAMRKARERNLNISFHLADMRTVSLGVFDAIISMYNSIGHLATVDLAQAARNAAQHLRPGGIFLVDIFNRDMMTLTPGHEYIDSMREVGDTKFVRFTNSRFDAATGLLSISQRTHVQRRRERPTIIPDEYTLQTYREAELRTLLTGNGFSEVQVSGEGMLEIFQIPGLVHFAVAKKAA